MKKHIVIAGLAVLSTSAWATQSRLEALGQDNQRGSFYIDDARNVFRNAAHVNQFNDYVVTEWGNAAGAAGVQQAEGGFFRSAGNFAYGLYLNGNRGDETSEHNNTTASLGGLNASTAYGDAGVLGNSNELDLFIGGDMGVQWGARIRYADSEDKPSGGINREHSGLGIGVGIVHGDLDAYVNYTLKDDHEGGTAQANKVEADGTMEIGASYDWMKWTFFANYSKEGSEFNNGTETDTFERTDLTVGAGYTHEVSSSSRLFTDISYVSTGIEVKTSATQTDELDQTSIPLTVGFEADANSWLTLRGSITQNVLINDVEIKDSVTTGNNREQSVANTTDVAAGATLNFGKLKVDGMIGTGGNDGNAGNAGTETGTLSLDRLMTRVAVHYWF